MFHYIEGVRDQADKDLQSFIENQLEDGNTDPKNIKLLYFYFVGSRNYFNKMQ